MIAVQPMTVKEWGELPEDDLRELVDGVLVEPEVAGFGHGHVVALLTAQLIAYFRGRGGFVVGDGVRLALRERRGRVPDAAVFLERPPLHGSVQVAPAIVIEVLSPGPENQRRDRIAKADEYAERGVAQYWIVDPDCRTVEIFAAQGGRYLRVAATDHGTLAVPGHDGLVLDLEDLFSWAAGDDG